MTNYRLILSVLAVALAVVVGPPIQRATAAIWEWSTTAGNNAGADPTINWAEGMSPSSVNNSARAMMARVAEWRNDISGAHTSAGTSTAYTLTTSEGVDTTPSNGQMVAFIAHTTNGVSPTLTVDGGTSYPLQSATGSVLSPGVLSQGTPYQVTFVASASAWRTVGFYGNPYSVPIGGMMPYTGSSAPNSNFVLPYGQCISRATYATYFALVGTAFGVCDGTTTFGVPDLRGRMIAGVDNMGGSTAGRVTTAGSSIDGTTMGAAGGTQAFTFARNQLPNTSISVTITDPGHNHTYTQPIVSVGGGAGSVYNNAQSQFTSTSTTGITAAFNLNGAVTQQNTVIMPPTIIIPFILRVI